MQQKDFFHVKLRNFRKCLKALKVAIFVCTKSNAELF